MSNTHSQAGNAKADRLRTEHPRFVYNSFSVKRLEDDLKLRFHFTIEPDIHFEPETTIKSIHESLIDSIHHEALENLVFHLGLIEMLSYWKATCSPEIRIKAGPLNEEQCGWLEDLLIRGMGEFFYVNRIDFRAADFVTIIAGQQRSNPTPAEQPSAARALVLASGGKDTALTLQLMKEAGTEFNCLMLNPLPAAEALVAQSGCKSPIIVRRTIDPRLLELNRQGYLNGHTPFSAYLAFLGVTCAAVFGYDRVVVSNERSSNEGNVHFLGAEINHQYSKTFEFEQRFRQYARNYLAERVSYFSLLRPLYEIQIIRLLASRPTNLLLFRSCNRNQNEGTWCGSCPKCVSTFTLFYPFLADEQLVSVFGAELFARQEAIGLLDQLAGLGGHKPFECVGTHDETIAALYLGVQKATRERTPLPAALRHAEESILPRYPMAAELASKLLESWNNEHNLPPEFEDFLRRSFVRAEQQ
jgi:hypothetical protein